MKYAAASIAKAVAKTYRIIKRNKTFAIEREILRELYLSRVAAASLFGMPERFGYSREPSHVETVLDRYPDLFSL